MVNKFNWRKLSGGQNLEDLFEKVRADKDILALIVFGSYARGEEYSDIDTCLVLEPKEYPELYLSKKRLQYLSQVSDKFDVQIFQQLPLYIKIRVLKEGKVLFCKDEDTLYELVFKTLKEFEDFKPRYYDYLEAIARA